MNALFKNIRKDRIIVIGFSLTFFFLFVNILVVLLTLRRLPPFLPLYNQMPWGEARLGTKIELFIPLLLVAAIFLVNLFFSSSIYEKMPLVSRILCLTSLFISSLALFFIARIILLIV